MEIGNDIAFASKEVIFEIFVYDVYDMQETSWRHVYVCIYHVYVCIYVSIMCMCVSVYLHVYVCIYVSIMCMCVCISIMRMRVSVYLSCVCVYLCMYHTCLDLSYMYHIHVFCLLLYVYLSYIKNTSRSASRILTHTYLCISIYPSCMIKQNRCKSIYLLHACKI